MIFDIIKRRRSVFPAQYIERPIARADIQKILEAANYAPTHKRTEPWRFKVLQGNTKDRLGLFLAGKYKGNDPNPKDFKYRKLLENTKRSGAVIVICMQRDPKESLPEWEELASTAMAVQNMWLCCTEMGIGCYWSSTGLIKYMHEFLDLNDGERCLGFFYMGHYDEEVPLVSRRPIEEKVTWL